MGSDYSVTSLINPPRIVMLQNRYKKYLDQLPFDTDMILKNTASFVGTSIHNTFEWMLKKHINTHPDDKYYLEQRVWNVILNRKISGKFDCMLEEDGNNVLYDFKNISTFKRIKNDWSDYEAQLNMYAYLLGLDGREVHQCRIVAYYTDWDKWKAQYASDPNYPIVRWEEIHFPSMWSTERQKDFLYGRIQAMIDNEDKTDEDLDACTEKDIWATKDVHAVYKVKEGKEDELPPKASRLQPTEQKAKNWMKTAAAKKKLKNGEKYIIQFRKGTRLRCQEYCRVNVFCNHYQDYIEEELI
jgi:hypothetical protein